MKAKYGVESSFQVKEFKDKAMKTKYEHRPNDPNNSAKIKQTMKSKYSENPTRFGLNGFEQHMKDVYGEEHFSQTEYFRYFRYFRYIRYKKYFYDDKFFDSSCELCFYKYCIDHNILIEQEPIKLKYFIDEKQHYYFPDFRINNSELIECKGEQFFENGKMINPFDRNLDYLYEAKHQCMIDNNVRIITNFFKYIDYCGKSFIDSCKVTKNLCLDYLDWKNLSDGFQTCIAIAKKANWKELYRREIKLWASSSKIRFDLLKNRVKYIYKTEDELTDLDIIRGLSIFGKIRAYSAFDNTGFKQVLDKYNICSVYDPCAGWGERLTTCAARDIRYFGVDINEAVIVGHNEIVQHYNLVN